MSSVKQIETISQELYNIDCPILDIGNREGRTGYIDFIKIDEFNEPFNKGFDKFGRKFISFRVDMEYPDGTIMETFTTLFQRHTDTESLWMVAGAYRKLFDTEGGTTLCQFQFLLKMFRDKTIDITEEMSYNCNLTNLDNSFGEESSKPIRIYLIERDKKKEVLKEKEVLEDVMKDLEKKVSSKILCNDNLNVLQPMRDGSKEFQERVGRPMTYSEMREMWG
jgi:hypothetical protein